MSLSESLPAPSDMASASDGGGDPLKGLPKPLILGSASFTRKLILKEMNIDFTIVVRPIDEENIGDRDAPPEQLVLTLAHAKMDQLVQEIAAGNCQDELPPHLLSLSSSGGGEEGCVILTADQVVTCNGQILEKPQNVEQAKEFVANYAHAPCSTVGCVVLTHLPSQIRVSDVHIATVHFRSSSVSSNDNKDEKHLLTKETASELVDDLIAEGAPVLSCAGGLMIEHPRVQQFVERTVGGQDSIMGLSKDTVTKLLNELRQQLLQKQQQPSSSQQQVASKKVE